MQQNIKFFYKKRQVIQGKLLSSFACYATTTVSLGVFVISALANPLHTDGLIMFKNIL